MIRLGKLSAAVLMFLGSIFIGHSVPASKHTVQMLKPAHLNRSAATTSASIISSPRVYYRQRKAVATTTVPSAGYLTDRTSTENSAFITAMPVDLNQFVSVSPFRSCQGHDYSGRDADNVTETMRSMKHYFELQPSMLGTTGVVKVFAPFDGSVSQFTENEFQIGMGEQVWLKPANGSSWTFVYFHITPLANISQGSYFKAGDLIGYVEIPSTAKGFDMGVKRFVDGNGNSIGNMEGSMSNIKEMNPGIYDNPKAADNSPAGYGEEHDSIFNHMTTPVLAAFAARGITLQNIIISKSYRDSNPCLNFIYKDSDYVPLL